MPKSGLTRLTSDSRDGFWRLTYGFGHQGLKMITNSLVVEPGVMVSRFVRRVRTDSGAVAVQVVTKQGQQVLEIDHAGSARTDSELALLLKRRPAGYGRGRKPGFGRGGVATSADAGHGRFHRRSDRCRREGLSGLNDRQP
jgi:hypothetical protein